MLFALTILQLYNGDPEAVSVLQELGGVNVEDNSGLLVEIILGFLAKPSTLMRRLSMQVFASFAGSLTLSGLKPLLDVLLTPETMSGAEELFDYEMDDEEDEDEEDEGDKDEHDDEDDEEMEEDDTEVEGDQEEDEDIEMSEDGEADEELDAALSAALGTTKPATTNGHTDPSSGEDSSSEELMNDEEMMALDESLATIFRQRLKSSTKAQQKETKQQISTFKCKVIDLLDILFQHPTPLWLETLLPLLQVLRVTKSEAVHAKTLGVLRKLAKVKELPDYEGDWAELMRKIHRDAERARGKDGNVHSQLSILLARIARKKGEEELVIGVYAETMRHWIKNGKSMVRAGLFSDWLNWCQSIRR